MRSGPGSAATARHKPDLDRDGVPNAADLCPNTAPGAPVDGSGCSGDQRDSDGDGVVDSRDQCPATPLGSPVNASGCSAQELDADGDGVPNATDACQNTAPGAAVDARFLPTSIPPPPQAGLPFGDEAIVPACVVLDLYFVNWIERLLASNAKWDVHRADSQDMSAKPTFKASIRPKAAASSRRQQPRKRTLTAR